MLSYNIRDLSNEELEYHFNALKQEIEQRKRDKKALKKSIVASIRDGPGKYNYLTFFLLNQVTFPHIIVEVMSELEGDCEIVKDEKDCYICPKRKSWLSLFS